MKKSLFALALLATATFSFAGGSIGVEQEHFGYRGSNLALNGTAITGSYDISPVGLTADARYQFGRLNNDTKFNSGEVGLRKDVAIGKFTAGLRGAAGRMYPQGAKSISYFVIDPTLTYAVTPKLAATAGVRFRNNFAGGARTTSPMGWLDYSVTNKDIVTVGYTRINGAVKADSVTASYTRLF